MFFALKLVSRQLRLREHLEAHRPSLGHPLLCECSGSLMLTTS